MGLDSGKQFQHVERFGDVIVRPDLQTQNFIDRLSASTEHQNGCCNQLLAQLPANLEATFPRNHDVQDDQVEVIARRSLDARIPIRSGFYAVTFTLQAVLKGRSKPRFVFDQEDLLCHLCPMSFLSCPAAPLKRDRSRQLHGNARFLIVRP